MKNRKAIHVDVGDLNLGRMLTPKEMLMAAAIIESALKDNIAASLGKDSDIADSVVVTSSDDDFTISMLEYAFFLNDGTREKSMLDRVGDVVPTSAGPRKVTVKSLAEGKWVKRETWGLGFIDNAIDYAAQRLREHINSYGDEQ